ncbi:MAG: TolC family protein [Muribaculaceae bacterium]|nr:TolC family protein [Muribaculaceae bacterium]
MSKIHLLIALLCLSICATESYAQQSYVLSIEQLLALADENNKTLRVENSTVIEAQQAINVAKNKYLPDIDISLSASYLGNGYLLDRDFTNGQNVNMPHFGNNFAIKASQIIYGGGAISNSVAMANLRKEMAIANREATRSRVRFLLIGFYLDLYKLQNTLNIYDHSIELAQTVINNTQARKDAGVALQNDVSRFKLQLKNLELAKKRVENAIEILNYDLVTMLGLPTNTYIQPDTTILNQSLPIENLEYWQEYALNNAHSINQSSIAVEIGKCNEQLARAERRPIITLFAANHFDGPITIEVPTIDKNFNHWHVGIGISFKLSSLYKTNKSIKRAQLNTELYRYRQDEVTEQINIDIQADYTKYLEAYDEIVTLEQSVKLATENYNIIENRYRNGIALVTDMLDASNQLLDAELQLINARINVIFNYYKLKNSSGNL